MGSPFGSEHKSIDRATTAKRQGISNTNAQNQFAQNYVNLFGGPQSNQDYQDSLSGYFNGQSIPQIAQMLAKTNSFQPKVKPTMQTSGGGGILGTLFDLSPGSPGLF